MDVLDIAVVIVSYKTAQLTVESLRSIETERATGKMSIRVVVVDNASGDTPAIGEAIAANRWSSWVSLVTAPRNGGFAYGNNLGIRHAYATGEPSYVYLLNPDAQVRPDGIGALVRFMQAHREVGIAGSSFENADGSDWPYAFRFPGLIGEMLSGLSTGIVTRLFARWDVPRVMSKRAQPVDWICGASMLIRPAVLEAIGGMDESFFLYYEETDFCRRAKLAGFSTWYVPESRVMHILGQSTSVTTPTSTPRRLPAYWFDSRRRYFAMAFGIRKAMLIDVVSCAAHALGWLKRRLLFRGNTVTPHFVRDLVKHSIIWPRNRAMAPLDNALFDASPGGARGNLLLELAVPFRVVDGTVLVETQAHQGLARWLENFSRVTACAPVLPEDQLTPTMTWTPVADLIESGRLTVYPLPWSYHPRAHWRDVQSVRELFRGLIPRHRYLCFSNLGTFGAWGRIAAEEAHRAGRAYAVWLDWVLHEMPLKPEKSALKGLWRRLDAVALKWSSLRDIRRCGLGLFHGLTVYEAYKRLAPVSKLVHDIHLDEADIVSAAVLERRLKRGGEAVKILYVGRAHEMKGPRQWLECIERLNVWSRPGQKQVQAEWVGDGPLLEEMRAWVRERGLSSAISLPGQIANRNELLDVYRAADLFVYCHLTPESPRCLVEALMSGLPLLGFESAYASDLVAEHGGGRTVPIGDIEGLEALVRQYMDDQKLRAEISREALASGRSFSEEKVFKHRADLIKQYL